MNTPNRFPNHLALLASGIALTGALASPAAADHRFSNFWQPDNHMHFNAEGNLVDVQVRVDGGSAPLFFRPNQWDRHYVQAFRGRNYSLVLRNNTRGRVGVLIAVDGLNVLSGERSNLSRHESMYVLGPFEEAEIRGWRTSLDHVQRFVFVDEERSYAERTGQANGDLGWIRVLSFREQGAPAWNQRYRPDVREKPGRGTFPEHQGLKPEGRLELEAPAEPESPSARREAAKNRAGLESFGDAESSVPGTGWGDRRYDPVQRTVFRAAHRPTDQLVIRYEYASGLRALGIFPHRSRLWERESGQLGFAKPPRW